MPDILIRGYKAKEQIEEIIEEARYAANNSMIGSGLEIVELPEHGDLVEAKSVCDTIDRFIGYLDEDMIFRIKLKLNQDAPVVIQSNKEV